MVDENLQAGGVKSKKNNQLERLNSANNKMPPAATNNSGEKTAGSVESATAKRRRSLFSVLFQKSNKSSEDGESAEKAPTKAKHEKIDMRSEISKSDIVLVRPAEAKCLEATIESMIPSDSEDEQRAHSRGRTTGKAAEATGPQHKKHSISRLIRRGGAKLRHKRREEDADSYVLDLDDQLELEKLRISSSSSSSSSSSLSPSSSESDSGEAFSRRGARGGVPSRGVRQPMSRGQVTWRTNQNYIPCDGEEPAVPPKVPPPRPPPPIGAFKGVSRRESASKRTLAPPAADRSRQKSPLLQEFLTSHRIDPLAAASSDEEDETHGSYDSLSYLSRLPLQSFNTSLVSGRELMSESDRRLYHWRKLAERSVTKWQVPQDSSCSDDSLQSDDDHDDGLQLMNCDSPALVCYCSDDTSCSSVELIWSRPQLQARQRQQNEMRRRDQLNLNSSRDSFVSQQFSDRHELAMSARRRASGSVSPRQLRPTQSYAPGHKAPDRMFLPVNISNNNNNKRSSDKSCTSIASCDSKLSGCNSNSNINNNNNNNNNISNNSWRQKPAVLELAKPLRARDRRIGARRKSDASQRRCRQPERAQRDLSSRASDEWQPNPLFGPQGRHLHSPLTKNSSVELAPSNGVSLRRGQSVELLNCKQQIEEQEAELSKSNRFKNFLARIKRLEVASSGDKTAEPATAKEEVEDEKQKSADEEVLDEFAVDESFDANERTRRHRWSLRMRSPFANNSSTGNTNNSPYFGQHLMNLDKRIKSNVSSLKSQLHDTGKRASVLADQLITTIKDTTKEQLISATTGTSARDRYDTLPNSFATPPNPESSTTEHSRAKQFALIFMHQQCQSTGQTVITKQPTAIGTGTRAPIAAALAPRVPEIVNRPTKPMESHNRASNSLGEGKDLEIIEIEEIMAECRRQSDTAVEQNEKDVITEGSELQPGQATTATREAVDTCQTNADLPEIVKPKRPPSSSHRKRLQSRKTRRQINVASQSDDEYNADLSGVRRVKTARRKYSLNDQFHQDVGCQHRCRNVTY